MMSFNSLSLIIRKVESYGLDLIYAVFGILAPKNRVEILFSFFIHFRKVALSSLS